MTAPPALLPGTLFATIAGIEITWTAHAIERLTSRDIPTARILAALEAEPTKLRAAVTMRAAQPLRFGFLTLVLRVVGERTVLIVTAWPTGTPKGT